MLKKIVLIVSLLLLGFAVSKSHVYKFFYAVFIQSDSIVELQSGNLIFDRFVGKRYCTTKTLFKYEAFPSLPSITFIENQYSLEDPDEYFHKHHSKYGNKIGELASGSILTLKKIFETDTFNGKDNIFQFRINSSEDVHFYTAYFSVSIKNDRTILYSPPEYFIDCSSTFETQ